MRRQMSDPLPSYLEGISKTPEQDAHAPELEEREEVLRVALVSGDQPAEVVEPGEQSLDLPATLVAAERTSILGRRSRPVPTMRRNEGDPSLLPEALRQGVAVVGLVPD